MKQRRQFVPYQRPDPRTVSIRVPPDGRRVIELSRRAPVYSSNEANLVRAYARALQRFGDVPREFTTTASEDVLTRAIAVRTSPNLITAKIVETAIQTMVRHSSRTYEGVRVAINVCMDLSLTDTGISLTSFLREPWAPLLGSGLNSAILVSADGSVLRVISLDDVHDEEALAPEPFMRVAGWTSQPARIAMSISRSGEMYVFLGGELWLVRRNSHWRAFPLSSLLDAGWFGTSKQQIKRPVKRAVLASLIDASAAHHGACLGIALEPTSVKAVIESQDGWTAAGNLRRGMFGTDSFLILSRRHRLELLSMDGATVLDRYGYILASGAILRVRGGQPGGGRSAAARTLAKYGIGIKVSQDGPITGLVGSGSHVIQHFAMG